MTDQSETGITRRRFLGYVVAGAGSLIAATIAAPLVGYFLSPEWKKQRTITIPIAKISDIPVGKPTFVRYEERVPDAWVIVTESKGAWVMTEDGEHFNVYDPHCTHLNCPYYWDDQKQIFQCPCHGGEFSINGAVLAGPPPRPLDRLEHRVEGDEIVVTGQITKGETSAP